MKTPKRYDWKYDFVILSVPRFKNDKYKSGYVVEFRKWAGFALVMEVAEEHYCSTIAEVDAYIAQKEKEMENHE